MTKAQADRLINISLSCARPAIAILWGSFGNKHKHIKNFWEKCFLLQKKHYTEIHFSNEASRRTRGRLVRRDIFHKLSVTELNRKYEKMSYFTERKIIKRVNKIRKLVDPYYQTGTFILSLGLEDNYTDKACKKLYKVIKKAWPYEIARSKVGNNPSTYYPKDVWIEQHHYDKGSIRGKKNILNGDGQSLEFLFPHKKGTYPQPASKERVQKWLAQADKHTIVLVWHDSWQGLHIPNPPKTNKRKFVVKLKHQNKISKLLSENEVR